MYWLLTVWISIGLATQVPWWLAPVFGAIAGAALQPLIWWIVGTARIRMSIDDAEFVARGWLWRDDIFVPRDLIESACVARFFDPRLHGLLWIRGMRTYPVKLELSLRTGDVVGIASSFAPRRISQRQADQLNAWVESRPVVASASRAQAGPASLGYAIDMTPRWIASMPWTVIAVLIGTVAAGLVVWMWLSGAPATMHWWPSLTAAVGGGVWAFGRLARRREPSPSASDEDHVF